MISGKDFQIPNLKLVDAKWLLGGINFSRKFILVIANIALINNCFL